MNEKLILAMPYTHTWEMGVAIVVLLCLSCPGSLTTSMGVAEVSSEGGGGGGGGVIPHVVVKQSLVHCSGPTFLED